MRKHKPSLWERRTIRQFLIFPKTLPLPTAYESLEERWWEWAEVVQVFKKVGHDTDSYYEDWVDEQWAD